MIIDFVHERTDSKVHLSCLFLFLSIFLLLPYLPPLHTHSRTLRPPLRSRSKTPLLMFFGLCLNTLDLFAVALAIRKLAPHCKYPEK